MRLAKRYGAERLEGARARALSPPAPAPISTSTSILKHGLDRTAARGRRRRGRAGRSTHENVRGADVLRH